VEIKSCGECPQAMQQYSFVLSCIDRRIKGGCDHSSEGEKVQFQTIGVDWMVGLRRKVVSPLRPTSRKKGGDRTTTLRRRDVGAEVQVSKGPTEDAHPLLRCPTQLALSPPASQLSPLHWYMA